MARTTRTVIRYDWSTDEHIEETVPERQVRYWAGMSRVYRRTEHVKLRRNGRLACAEGLADFLDERDDERMAERRRLRDNAKRVRDVRLERLAGAKSRWSRWDTYLHFEVDPSVGTWQGETFHAGMHTR